MAYTPTVYTNDAGSPDLDATNLTKSENGIKDAHLIAVPVDCTSRVAEYTGDGGGATIKDRAGNGNNITATNITYVNGRFGKEMSFNGSSSYAQASSPVIGTTGTISVRFKINALGASQVILDNRDGSGYNGVMILITPTGAINIELRGVSGSSHTIVTTQTITAATYNSVVVTFSSSQMIIYLNGVAINTSTITITPTASVTNLQIGMRNAASYLNGVISSLRYDSRIWTADEVRAFFLNPISIDSRV